MALYMIDLIDIDLIAKQIPNFFENIYDWLYLSFENNGIDIIRSTKQIVSIWMMFAHQKYYSVHWHKILTMPIEMHLTDLYGFSGFKKSLSLPRIPLCTTERAQPTGESAEREQQRAAATDSDHLGAEALHPNPWGVQKEHSRSVKYVTLPPLLSQGPVMTRARKVGHRRRAEIKGHRFSWYKGVRRLIVYHPTKVEDLFHIDSHQAPHFRGGFKTSAGLIFCFF